MATLAVLRNTVAETLKLDNSTSGDQGMIDEWINDAVKDLLVRTHARTRVAAMALSSGAANYTLDPAIYSIRSVYNATTSSNYLMTRVDMDEMVRLRIGSTGTAPAQYYCVDGADMLQVYPTPGTGETLTVVYVPAPTALSASSDTPSEIPTEWHDAIKLYALAKAGEYAQHRPSDFGMSWWGQYEKRVREIRAARSRKGGDRLPPAVLAGQRPRSHDRSQYP